MNRKTVLWGALTVGVIFFLVVFFLGAGFVLIIVTIDVAITAVMGSF